MNVIKTRCFYCKDEGLLFADAFVKNLFYEAFVFKCVCIVGKSLKLKSVKKDSTGKENMILLEAPYPQYSREWFDKGYYPKKFDSDEGPCPHPDIDYTKAFYNQRLGERNNKNGKYSGLIQGGTERLSG